MTRSPLGEEIGSRGFALPQLQSRYAPVPASLILGLLWTFWHAPICQRAMRGCPCRRRRAAARASRGGKLAALPMAVPRKYLARDRKSVTQFSHISHMTNEPLGNITKTKPSGGLSHDAKDAGGHYGRNDDCWLRDLLRQDRADLCLASDVRQPQLPSDRRGGHARVAASGRGCWCAGLASQQGQRRHRGGDCNFLARGVLRRWRQGAGGRGRAASRGRWSRWSRLR